MAALTAAFLALTAANTANQFINQRRAASGAESQGDYESGILLQDANIADQQSADAIARGKEAEQRSREQTKQVLGAQRTGYAAQGVAVDTGSAVDVGADTARTGELDALTLRNNARREAWGFDVQAADLRAKAAMAKAAGRNTAASLRNASYGTLLNGAISTFGIGKDLAGEYGSSKGSMIGSRGWGG